MYWNLVCSDQQMQRLEETELRKADRMVWVGLEYQTRHERAAGIEPKFAVI